MSITEFFACSAGLELKFLDGTFSFDLRQGSRSFILTALTIKLVRLGLVNGWLWASLDLTRLSRVCLLEVRPIPSDTLGRVQFFQFLRRSGMPP